MAFAFVALGVAALYSAIGEWRRGAAYDDGAWTIRKIRADERPVLFRLIVFSWFAVGAIMLVGGGMLLVR